MTEIAEGAQGSDPQCPWCSSAVPEAVERCPSCGAALREAATNDEGDIPGVTQVDPVVGLRRQARRPNRLVGWLADVDVDPMPAFPLAPRSAVPGASQALEGVDAASVAPPSDEVRREIRRLELEALKAQLEQRTAEARVAAMDAGLAVPGPESRADGAGSQEASSEGSSSDGPSAVEAPGEESPASPPPPDAEGTTGG